MAVENNKKSKEKQGLLAYFEPGQRLPFFPDDVPHRVSKTGRVEWAPIADYLEFLLNANEGLRSYLQSKEDWIYNSIFRGWNLLSRALLGHAVHHRYDWSIPQLPTEVHEYWEEAPQQIQSLAFLGAREYLNLNSNQKDEADNA